MSVHWQKVEAKSLYLALQEKRLLLSVRSFFFLWLCPLGTEAHGRTNSLKWIVKLTCGSFQRGNSISLRSVCFSPIKHSSRHPVFWAGCYRRVDGVENEIRGAKIAGRWPNRGEASRCDCITGPCCMAISQPGGCQLSTMEGHKHALYIHGFPCMAQEPSPYVSCCPSTLQRALWHVCCGLKSGAQWVNG